MNARLAVVLLAVSFGGCTTTRGSGCVGKHMDFAWVPFSEREPIADVSALIEPAHGRAFALQLMGEPLREDGSQLSWAYGMRREGRDCMPDGKYASTFLIKYAIVDVVFVGDAIQSCNVTEKTMISQEPQPNPFDEHSISTHRTGCREFLISQGQGSS